LTIIDSLGEYPFGTGTLMPLDYVDGSVSYYVNGILQAQPTTVVNPFLVISGLSVPAGGVVTIIYVARTNQYAPLGMADVITNSAVISGGGVTDIIVTENVAPESGARLTITKTMSPTVITENGRLTYTFTIQNTGNTPIVATDDVIVTDSFNPILRDLAVVFNGTAWTAPVNYTYNEETGAFETGAGQITVPAATYSQNPVTGEWIIEPGVSVLTVTGTV